MATRSECVDMSLASYPNSEVNMSEKWVKLDQIFNENTGLSAIAYKNSDTNEIIIAYAGTTFDNGLQDGFNDMRSNVKVAVSELPFQIDEASVFYEIIKNQNQDSQITITGHSLGGALAQLLGAKYDINTVTFNAPGVKHILENMDFPIQDSYSNITNYNLGNDFMNILNIMGGLKQIGTSYIIPSTDDYPFYAHNDFESLANSATEPFALWYYKNEFICDFLLKYSKTGNPEKIIDIIQKLDTNLGLLDNFIAEMELKFKELFHQSETIPPVYSDPLLIDLNGDGIKTTTLNNGTYFDHDVNGFAEKTAWVDANDGILAFDKNNNGTIDNGSGLMAA